MRRDPQAFLKDVLDAGNAIFEAVEGISLADYCRSVEQTAWLVVMDKQAHGTGTSQFTIF